MKVQYSAPINKLLTRGECRRVDAWVDYSALGLRAEHIPELIRMAVDKELSNADSDSPEVWAPVHAWRALAQLRAIEAISPLIGELHNIDDEQDDWVAEEFPEVFAMIGPPAIVELAEYLAEPSHPVFAKVCAASSLRKIGNAYPEQRDECIRIITEQLSCFTLNVTMLNGFLVAALVDLEAVDSLDTIREAFNQDYVDLSVMGDIEDVEIEFGVRTQRSTPPPRMFPWLADVLNPPYSLPAMRTTPKTGRNDPCPCGSGKKYKKCCLQN